MNALFQETAHTFLNCNGDFRDAAKKLASTPTVRNSHISTYGNCYRTCRSGFK